jgi:hypothetical protein
VITLPDLTIRAKSNESDTSHSTAISPSPVAGGLTISLIFTPSNRARASANTTRATRAGARSAAAAITMPPDDVPTSTTPFRSS